MAAHASSVSLARDRVRYQASCESMQSRGGLVPRPGTRPVRGGRGTAPEGGGAAEVDGDATQQEAAPPGFCMLSLATGKVGADRVRALIAETGLRSIRIPDSTRRFFSYLLGAPAGVDLGWPGVVEAASNPPGPLRPALNEVITLAGSARDFVSWYEQALQGRFFTHPETLVEFKRIQAMSVQIPETVPPDTPAYAKGGEFPSSDVNAKSFAGQIVVGRTPVTFCFIVNWDGSVSDFLAVEAEFFAAIKGILGVIKRALAAHA